MNRLRTGEIVSPDGIWHNDVYYSPGSRVKLAFTQNAYKTTTIERIISFRKRVDMNKPFNTDLEKFLYGKVEVALVDTAGVMHKFSEIVKE